MSEAGIAGPSSISLLDAAARTRLGLELAPSGLRAQAADNAASSSQASPVSFTDFITGQQSGAVTGFAASAISAGLSTFLQQAGNASPNRPGTPSQENRSPDEQSLDEQTSDGQTLDAQATAQSDLEAQSDFEEGIEGVSAFDVPEEAQPAGESDQSAAEEAVEQATDPDAVGPDGLTAAEREVVSQLRERDAEVRRHEQAHAAVGGPYAGAPTYTYETGPDGNRYAVSGEVSIDSSPVRGDPEATIRKLQVVRRAALAPASPSPQDQRVAAQAQQDITRARAELAQERLRGDAPEPGQIETEAGQLSETIAEFDPTPEAASSAGQERLASSETGAQSENGAENGAENGSNIGFSAQTGAAIGTGLGASPGAATPQQVSNALSEAALLGNGETVFANFPRIDPGRLFNLTS